MVVSCTASTLPIIGLGAVERALKARKHRPMFMVDLAVPRDIEPEVKALEDVYLYTVDDLAHVVQTGQANRQAAVAQAEGHHRRRRAELRALDGPARHRAADPAAQRAGRRMARRRMARARKLLAKGEDGRGRAGSLSRGLTQKMLHGAMAELHMRRRRLAPADGADDLAPVPAQRALATLVSGPAGLCPAAAAFMRLCRCNIAAPLPHFFRAFFAMKPFLRQQLERYPSAPGELDFLPRAKTS
jgi:hypothetical protein